MKICDILTKSLLLLSIPKKMAFCPKKVTLFPRRGFLSHSTGGGGVMMRSFVDEVTSWLNETNISYEHVDIDITPHNVIGLGKMDDYNYKVGLHLLPVPTPRASTSTTNSSSSPPNSPPPSLLSKRLTDDTNLPFDIIVHLHQDIWINKHDIVKARLNAKLGRVKQRWYARQTKAVRIHLSTAMDFLEANHLWGATRAKFNYGLMSGDELVAVATFSPRRHVERGLETNRPFRSHELIRYCSTKDGHVIGGITKLIAAFCRDFAPDDLVTCIDRDWGDGSGWTSIGFEKVSVMPPLIMSVGQSENSIDHWTRYYLVGAGVGVGTSNSSEGRKGRPGINIQTFNELNKTNNSHEAKCILERNGLFPVYDAGVERRMLVTKGTKLDKMCMDRRNELEIDDIDSKTKSILELWQMSTPSFPDQYYSPNNMGIDALLEDAASSDT